MKTKLVFVVNSLQGGGAERVVSTLCSCLCKGNFDITIICLNKAEQAYKVAEEVKMIHLVNRRDTDNIFFRIWYALLTLFGLIFALKREKPKCAVSFMTTANLWTGFVCRLVAVPYFVSERITPDYTIHQFNNFLKWFSFKIYRKSRAIVVPARGIEECFKKYKAFESLKNFKTIHNPVSRFRVNDAPSVYPRRFVLGVGRLDKQKGFDLLIEAYHILKPDNVDLLISGEGPDREQLQAQIDSYGFQDRIKLIGFKNNIHDYYKQADMFVLSSRNEGYPNALVEAMSFGCAVIAADCEFGPSEIIDNERNGLLVKVNNVFAIARAMSKLLNDPILKFRISQNALMINQTNSLDAISAKWENLILSHV